ncbi:MAG: porin [Burkholderiaceae bacterium]
MNQQDQTNFAIRVVAAACAVLISSTAMAATEISMYGIADVYMAVQKGDRTEVAVDSGGIQGSRLGFKASHDIATGLKAIAKLEAGIGIDQGSSTQGGRTWGRQAYAGLTGDSFGTLTIGRQYTPTFNAIDNDDPFETGAGSVQSSGIITTTGGTRANNSINWESPTFSNITFDLMYAAGETAKPNSNSDASFIGAGARYSAGPAALGLVYGHQNRQDNTQISTSSLLLEGSYDFGTFSLSGGAQAVRNATQVANVSDNRAEYYAGVHIPVAGDQVWAGAGTGKYNGVSNTRATQFSLAYLHFLDKSTTIYGVLTSISNGSNVAYTTDTATGSGPAVSAGKDPTALEVGFRYKF